jgi:hypothetical protein
MSTSTAPYFALKVLPAVPGAAPEPSAAALYFRHHGSGHNGVMLMPAPPVYLRAVLDDDGRVIYTSRSPKSQQLGRWWGLVLPGAAAGVPRAGWEAVEIVEGHATPGFSFGEDGELLWTPPPAPPAAEGEEAKPAPELRGWLALDWALGHRQLFWLTDAIDGKGREFGAEVVASKIGDYVRIFKEEVKE